MENITLRLALAYVIEAAGHQTTVHRDIAELTVVDLPGLVGVDGVVDTVVVDPLPVPCQRAVDTIVSGRARTAITTDDPHALVAALTASHNGAVTLPQSVIERAKAAPRLPDRLTETLHLVVAGHTNTSIARRLHQSESTVKRDITALLHQFRSPNRHGLAGAAAAAGDHRETPWGPRLDSSSP